MVSTEDENRFYHQIALQALNDFWGDRLDLVGSENASDIISAELAGRDPHELFRATGATGNILLTPQDIGMIAAVVQAVCAFAVLFRKSGGSSSVIAFPNEVDHPAMSTYLKVLDQEKLRRLHVMVTTELQRRSEVE